MEPNAATQSVIGQPTASDVLVPDSDDDLVDRGRGSAQPKRRDAELDNPLRRALRRSLEDLDFGRPAVRRRLKTDQQALVSDDCPYADAYVGSLIRRAYLVGSARARNEVQLKGMDASTYALYEAAMAKEWGNWLNFGAVEILDEDQIKALPRGVKSFGAKWVHTGKAAQLRVPSTAAAHLSIQAKSRLVVQGHQ